MPPLGAFLPYPLALDSNQLLDCPHSLIATIMINKSKLPPELSVLLEEEHINSKITSSYFWLSSQWMYE